MFGNLFRRLVEPIPVSGQLDDLDRCKPLQRIRRQNWPMVFVASSSQSASASKVINSMELKNFTAFGLDLPSARSFPALTRIATSSVVQFNSFAT